MFLRSDINRWTSELDAKKSRAREKFLSLSRQRPDKKPKLVGNCEISTTLSGKQLKDSQRETEKKKKWQIEFENEVEVASCAVTN